MDGTEGLEVGSTDDPTIKLLEAAVSGFEQVSDRDAAYTTLTTGGQLELVPGLAIGIDSLSSIDTSATEVRLSLAGAQLFWCFAAPTSLQPRLVTAVTPGICLVRCSPPLKRPLSRISLTLRPRSTR